MVDRVLSSAGKEDGETGGYTQNTDLPFVQTGGSQPSWPQENAGGQTEYADTHQTGEEPQHIKQSDYTFYKSKNHHCPP